MLALGAIYFLVTQVLGIRLDVDPRIIVQRAQEYARRVDAQLRALRSQSHARRRRCSSARAAAPARAHTVEPDLRRDRRRRRTTCA